MQLRLNELESHIPQHESRNESISKVTVGWHIHHALMVINGICLTLMRSKEADYPSSSFNWKKHYVFLTGKFPRGKAKAPTKTNQKDELSIEDIEKQLANARKLIGKLESLAPKSHFKHAIFGVLNLKESKRFLQIHTKHHLKIIRDILN